MALRYSPVSPSSWVPAAFGTILIFLVCTAASSHPTGGHRHDRWASFQNLTGVHHGVHQPGLAELKRYFHRFGYISAGSPANFSDNFDHDLESALLTYQHNFHLDATGKLDVSTLSLLTKPRCGVADVVHGTTPHGVIGRNLYAVFPGSPTWPSDKRHLTYAFTASDVSLPVRAVVASAFSRWSDASAFSFVELTANKESADVFISFFSGDHGDGLPFDGMGGMLAHAFAPTDGRLHVDADEEWFVDGDVTESSSPYAYDLESVMVHEIGHILGLAHSRLPSAIMYPTIPAQAKKVELTNDDVWGIQSLYGSN